MFLCIKMTTHGHCGSFTDYYAIVIPFEPKATVFPNITSFLYNKFITIPPNTDGCISYGRIFNLNNVIIANYRFLQINHSSLNNNIVVFTSNRKE